MDPRDRNMIGLAVAAAVLVMIISFGSWMPHRDAWTGVWGGTWGFAMAFMMVVPALLLAFLIIGLLRAVGAVSPSRDAQAILDERLARGEISIDEHRERSDALKR